MAVRLTGSLEAIEGPRLRLNPKTLVQSLSLKNFSNSSGIPRDTKTCLKSESFASGDSTRSIPDETVGDQPPCACKLEKIQAAVLAINFADDELNPPELGIFDRAKQHVRNGQFVLIPASSQTQGHMTIRKASVYAPYVADVLTKLPASP